MHFATGSKHQLWFHSQRYRLHQLQELSVNISFKSGTHLFHAAFWVDSWENRKTWEHLISLPSQEGKRESVQRYTDSNIRPDLPNGVLPFELPPDEDERFHGMHYEEIKMATVGDKLLKLHYILNHLLFAKIRFMSALGWVDRRLSKSTIPKCAGCLYEQSTRKPWRNKGEFRHIMCSDKPGDVAFIDQLTVTIPGLFGQVTGFLTYARYHYDTRFLDHFPYIVQQRSSMGEEIVKAKACFEVYACYQ